MHTVVQNDEKDYDIDVAIVFEKDNLNGLGARATREMVADALKIKTKQFNAEPEVKTSCVRIKYKEGYHIDFAIYRRYKEDKFNDNYKYEHAGNSWSERGIRSLEDWFKNEIKYKGNKIRNIIRFSKMFCKSREFWKNMPSGLIQTILCSEQLVNINRIDELFYITMKKIINRINNDLEVSAPVDNNRPIVTREIDRLKMENWKNRLSDKLEKLEILFDDECTYNDAVSAWNSFFKHDYWEKLSNENTVITKSTFIDTEEFIEDKYIVDEQYDVVIDCKVKANGFSTMAINKFIDKYFSKFGRFIPHNFSVECSIGYTNAPSYDEVLWKVRNVGDEAEKRNYIRGQIFKKRSIIEHTLFKGEHYIECYLIKNNICIAIGYIEIPIGNS